MHKQSVSVPANTADTIVIRRRQREPAPPAAHGAARKGQPVSFSSLMSAYLSKKNSHGKPYCSFYGLIRDKPIYIGGKRQLRSHSQTGGTRVVRTKKGGTRSRSTAPEDLYPCDCHLQKSVESSYSTTSRRTSQTLPQISAGSEKTHDQQQTKNTKSTKVEYNICKHCGGLVKQPLTAWYSDVSLCESIYSSFDRGNLRRPSLTFSSSRETSGSRTVPGSTKSTRRKDGVINEHLAMRRKTRVPSNALSAVAQYNEQILQERRAKLDERNHFEGSQKVEGQTVLKPHKVLPSIPRGVNRDMEMFAIASVERHNKPPFRSKKRVTFPRGPVSIGTILEDGESRASMSRDTYKARQFTNKASLNTPRTPRTTPVSARDIGIDFDSYIKDVHKHNINAMDLLRMDLVPNEDLNEIIRMQNQFLIRQPPMPLPGIPHANGSPTKSGSKTTTDESTLAGLESLSFTLSQYETSDRELDFTKSVNGFSLTPQQSVSPHSENHSIQSSTEPNGSPQKSGNRFRNDPLSILTSDDSFSVGSSPMKYTLRPTVVKQGYFYYNAPVQNKEYSRLSRKNKNNKSVENETEISLSETPLEVAPVIPTAEMPGENNECVTENIASAYDVVIPIAEITAENTDAFKQTGFTKTEHSPSSSRSSSVDSADIRNGVPLVSFETQMQSSTKNDALNSSNRNDASTDTSYQQTLLTVPCNSNGQIQTLQYLSGSHPRDDLPEIRMTPATPLPANWDN